MSRQSAESGKRGFRPVSNNPLSMAGSMVQPFMRPKAHRVNSSILFIGTKPSATVGFSYVELVTAEGGSSVGGVVGGTGGGVGVGMAVGAAVGGTGVGLDGATVLMTM